MSSFIPPAFRNLFSHGSPMNPKAPPVEEQEPKPEPDEPMGEQIPFDDEEKRLIANQIEEDIASSTIANGKRAAWNAMYQDSWRNQVGLPKKVDGTPNFEFPLIPIQVLQKMATENQSLFGDDASVTAVPTRPIDAQRVEKAGLYMRWLVFTRMEIIWRWTVFSWRRLMFGRAFAVLSYAKQYYDHPTKGRVCYAESPTFDLIDADDVFTPGEDAESAQDFSFFAYRYYATPDDLLLGEQESEIYTGIEENWDEILRVARDTSQRDTGGTGQQGVKDAKDRAAGVDVTGRAYQGKEFIEVFAWFGRRRMKAADAGSEPGEITQIGADENPVAAQMRIQATPVEVPVGESQSTATADRELRQTDIVVRWAPKLRGVVNLHGIIGAQKLAELYPDTPTKRPIYEAALGQTGEYWPMGLPEMLWSIKQELTTNENLATQGGQFSVGPTGFYKPASGANPDVLKITPGLLIPSNNPKEDVAFFNINFNPEFPVLKQNNMLSLVEKLLGNMDFSTGREGGRPNAPRTARGTLALLSRGDLRVNFDTSFLLLDFGKLLKRLWELCAMYAPASQFFRVTGEDAEGLLKSEVKDGFASMTAEEFGGEFDFALQPATGIHAKEAAKDDLLQAFALALQLPIIQMNANAQWRLTRMALKPFGIQLEKIMPEPQPPELSVDPKEEWLAMLRGEDAPVHPGDDDQAHLVRHNMDLQKMDEGPEDEKDPKAMYELFTHIQETLAQIQAKQQQQAQMAAVLQHVTALAMAAHASDAAQGNGNGSSKPKGKSAKGATPVMAQIGMPADAISAETMGAQRGPNGMPPMG